MTLNSVRLQSQVSLYDPADQENVYDMSHPRRGHFLLINNRHFDQATGKKERRGSDVDAANLFTAFKQLGFEVDLKSNQTRQDMLRVAIECKSSSSHLIVIIITVIDNRFSVVAIQGTFTHSPTEDKI